MEDHVAWYSRSAVTCNHPRGGVSNRAEFANRTDRMQFRLEVDCVDDFQ